MHFGASHAQASLHTVVLYSARKPPTCICTISENLEHGPIGIWAHLKPVLKLIKDQYAEVKHLIFWSDGPSSQYKQKNNFYRLSLDPFMEGYKTVCWNFFESSHGKGAVDGVGAVIKRSANDAVRRGVDINTPRRLYDIVGPMLHSVKLIYIKNEDFIASYSMLPTVVPTIKGTRDIHQIYSLSQGIVNYRRITCLCQSSNLYERYCSCYDLKTFAYCDAISKFGAVIRSRVTRTKKLPRMIVRLPKPIQETIDHWV